ncbi:MAG: 3-hydroxyacyl-CoA dehydrogenase [bacterium]
MWGDSEQTGPVQNNSPPAPIARAVLVGAGLVGRSWAIVFARAGVEAVLHDPFPEVGAAAMEKLKSSLIELEEHGLLADWRAVLGRVRFDGDLSSALAGADWIQESAPESLEVKRKLFTELDAKAPPGAIIASSTSGFSPSAFTEHVAGRERTLVAHPVNPPHLAPLVEIVPAPWTDPGIAKRAGAIMEALDQKPILVRKEIDGFVLNRIQGVVLDEAFRLVQEGYVSVEDVDRAMVYGLATRWSFMGPFETIDLNAPGGIKDYVERYREMYHRFAAARSSDAKPWDPEAVSAVEADRRNALPLEKISERSGWRDRVLMRIAAQRAHLNGGSDSGSR